jgi:hypothetical protein
METLKQEKININNLNKQDLTGKQQNLIKELVIEFLKEGKSISVKVEEKQPDGILLSAKNGAKIPTINYHSTKHKIATNGILICKEMASDFVAVLLSRAFKMLRLLER